MKKIGILFMVALLVSFMMISLVSCTKKAETVVAPAATVTESPKANAVQGTYKDGIYFAVEETFASSGWKYAVTLEVENGSIVKADWNGVNVSAGATKKAYDKAGKYNMVKFAKAQAEWYEQAAKAEAHLLETQDPSKITYKDAEGHTDDIAGVSIHVVEFFDLAKVALAKGPVGRGSYADGAYYMVDNEFASSGWKEYVALTVINGNIVGVNWSAFNRSGDDKKLYDAAGKYNMVKFGKAQAEWSVQAARAEAYLIETQDPSKITYKDDEGHTDAISGVSVHVNSLFDLASAALKAGPRELGPYKDGGYYAIQDAFGSSGWKEYVSLFVENGNIVNVYWSALNEKGDDKKVYDMDGKYNMKAYGKAQAEWYEQAAKVEQYLLDSQDVAKISYTDDEGHTDAIGGVSIHVNSLFELAAQALKNGVVSYK
ncbi:MAG: hypothetical protein EOM67_07170 [Spirochaetia bacterium]|nr:hypothetical protein [Spirochaetia bacterium]